SGAAARSIPMPMTGITGVVLIESFLLSISFPCQSFGQLYTRPDRIHNKFDLQTDSRHFTEGRVEGHAGRLKGLHKRLEIPDLETDVIDRATFCRSGGRPGRQEVDFVSVEHGARQIAPRSNSC